MKMFQMLSQNDQSHQSHTHLAQSIFADERDRDSMPDMWGQHKLTQQQVSCLLDEQTIINNQITFPHSFHSSYHIGAHPP